MKMGRADSGGGGEDEAELHEDSLCNDGEKTVEQMYVGVSTKKQERGESKEIIEKKRISL